VTRYRAPAAGELRWAELGEVSALYHRTSGQTHVVVSPVPEILALLAGEWLDVGALLARLTGEYEVGDPDPAALAARLDELVDTGLIERA